MPQDQLSPSGEGALNIIGPATSADQHNLERKLEDKSFTDTVGTAFKTVNAGVGIYNWLAKERYPVDPSFSISQEWDTIGAGLPQEYASEFDGVGSMDEALQIRGQLQAELQGQRELNAQGITGFAAMGIASILDVDAPLMFLTGGLSAGAKGVSTGSKIMKGTVGVRAGLLSGLITESANAAARPGTEWADVPLAGLTGMVMGGGFHAAGAFNKNVRKTGEELIDAIKTDNIRAQRPDNITVGDDGVLAASPRKPVIQPVDGLNNNFPSVGAAGGKVPGQGTADELSDGMVDTMQKARQFIRDNGIEDELNSDPSGKFAQTAMKFKRAIDGTPFGTDFDRYMRMESAVAKKTAYELFESASGVARNNQSASMVDMRYQKRIMGHIMPEYEGAWSNYAKSQGINKIDAHYHGKGQNDFNRAVFEEMQARYHDGRGASTDPNVLRVADAYDRMSADALEVGKGRAGEAPLRGFENLQAKTGWMHTRWSGGNIRKVIDQGASRANVEDALAKGYKTTHPAMTDADALIYAKATIRRALSREDGIDTSAINLMRQDGRETLTQMLTANGVSRAEADRIVRALSAPMEEAGQEGFAKKRLDVDLRTEVNGVKLMDLVDTDIPKVASLYARQLSGASALARKGIATKADRTRIVETILTERRMNGEKFDAQKERQFMEDMFTYFDAGPIGGGLSPAVSRAKKLTNLSLLNQLGVTQLAETGVSIAAVGWEHFATAAKAEIAAMRKGKSTALLDEFAPLTGEIGGDHRLFRDDLALDMDRANQGTQSELMAHLDKFLNKGQRLQGYISGFYKVRQLQQRVAVRSMANKVMQASNGRGSITPERLADLGLKGGTLNKVNKYATNGTVEFNPDGTLKALNLDKWDDNTADQFADALNRHTYQVVQQSMAGESTMWMHKDVGSLMVHLKTFPLLAAQKQLVRNIRLSNTDAVQTALYGLMTAGVAYTAKQVINGRDHNLNSTDIMKGAISLSNMTGVLPMMADPIGEMLGIDAIKFHNYTRGVDAGIVGAPAALSVLNRLGHVPGAAAAGPLPGVDMSSSDWRALASVPLIGNAYGVSAIMNELKK